MPYGKLSNRPLKTKRIAGIICILLAAILLLLCAPGWLVALIASGMLFLLGAWLLYGQGRPGPPC